MIFKLFLVVLVLMAIGVVGMAITIILKKDGQFPQTHVGQNKNMRKLGIRCAKTFDKAAQAQVTNKLQLKGIRLADDFKA